MKALRYGAAHLLWLVNALFGVWFWLISRNTWLAAFNQYYIHGSPTRSTRADLLDRVFSIILGLAWFVMVIGLETFFKKGVDKDDLLRRFAKATGPILIGVFAVDFILTLIQGLTAAGWLRFAILAVELVLGLALVRFGWIKRIATKPTPGVRGLN